MSDSQARIVLTEQPYEYEESVSKDCELVRLSSEIIGIDEIRSLISEAHRQPKEIFTAKKIVLVGLKITSEAQQSSLKILEEPTKNTSITIVLPSGTQLLGTVLSRVQLDVQVANQDIKTFQDWQKLSYADRISEVEKRTKAKDTAWLQEVKSGVIQYCREIKTGPPSDLKEISLVVDNLQTRGASNKMLLEHLALSMPLTE